MGLLNQIKKARLIAGLKQGDVAKAMGITQASVCQWESGRSHPVMHRLPKLAEVLHTTVEKLLEEEERAM